jgi:hypothetical protein
MLATRPAHLIFLELTNIQKLLIPNFHISNDQNTKWFLILMSNVVNKHIAPVGYVLQGAVQQQDTVTCTVL